jgi:hypothetical protein
MPQSISEQELSAIVAKEIAASLAYDRTELAEKRRRAIEYMRGEMSDWPAEKGRSSVVSRDTSDVVSWILPGIIRLFTASGQMAVAEPVEPGDERWATSATDGINHAFWKDNDGYRLLYDTTWNSLLHGNGVIKHWWDDRPKTAISFHTGLTDEQLTALLTPETVEVGGEGADTIELLASTTRLEKIVEPDPQTGAPREAVLALHDVKVRRTTRRGQVRLACVAPEDFLINAEATAIRGARLVGQKEPKTRSDLVEMGFDRDRIERLARDTDDDATEMARQEFGRFEALTDSAATTALETVTLYELYLKLDVDGDGIAETCQVFYAGQGGEGTVLEWSVWEDEEVFSDIPCEPVPHRWDANAVFDKTKDIQEIKTVLSRQALDNLYASNNPQRFVTGRVLNPDELANPSFGGTVFAETGASCLPLSIPFFANHAFEGIAYFDQVIEKRTGVSKTTMALDPEALQNQTATAAQLSHDAAYSQTELIARNQAELGWKQVFRAVLKLMVRHQDRARTIRLGERWVEIDPRHWNADMDITINTGLGTGSRDRDMAMLGRVKSDQVTLAAAFREAGMIDHAVGMIPMIIATMKKSAEAAGLRTSEMFYPDVGREEVAKALAQISEAQAGGGVDPGAKAAAEKAALDFRIESARADNEMRLKREKLAGELQLKREDFLAEMALKDRQIAAEIALKERLAVREMEMRAYGLGGGAPDVHVGGEPG